MMITPMVDLKKDKLKTIWKMYQAITEKKLILWKW